MILTIFSCAHCSSVGLWENAYTGLLPVFKLCVYIYIYMYICVCVCVCVCIYIYLILGVCCCCLAASSLRDLICPTRACTWAVMVKAQNLTTKPPRNCQFFILSCLSSLYILCISALSDKSFVDTLLLSSLSLHFVRSFLCCAKFN